MSLASRLRNTGKIVEVYPNNSNIKKQMTYANKKNVKFKGNACKKLNLFQFNYFRRDS